MSINSSKQGFTALKKFMIVKGAGTGLKILIIASLMVPVFIKPSPAMDYLVGAKGGYFVWDPYLTRLGHPQFKDMKKGSGVLYGPVVSVLFSSDLSLSVSGLFGTQLADWTSKDFIRGNSTSYTTAKFTTAADRMDVDSALSLRLTENFKVFAGYKYQNFDMEMKSVGFERNATGLTSAEVQDIEIKMPFHGPAAGIGFSAPLGDRFFFASNLSAIYMWGNFEFKSNGYQYRANDTIKYPGGGNGSVSGIKMNTRGLNLEPTVGASMGEAMPIFTLGVRMQWSQTKFLNAEKIEIKEKWCNDYQYGLFVSIVQPF